MSAVFHRLQMKISKEDDQDFWLSVDSAIDAMADSEYLPLAQIALLEYPDAIRERFATKDLRTIKSIRGRVFELWKTEQPA